MAVEQIALDRLAESRGATVLVHLPSREEHEGAAQSDVWTLRLLGRVLKRHDIPCTRFRPIRATVGLEPLDHSRLAVDRREVPHTRPPSSKRARKRGFRSDSPP